MSKRHFSFGLGVIGIVQILALSGCVGHQNTSETVSKQSVSQGASGTEAMFPTRMSRALFEKPLTAEVSIYDSAGFLGDIRDSVQWEARTEDNNGDHQECIALEATHGFRFCFLLANDVSSFELSAKKTSVEAVRDFICEAAPSQCNAPVQSVEWLSAKKQTNGFEVNYLVLPDYKITVSVHD